MRKDGRTDRHDEANSRIRSFANAPNNCYLNVYRIHVSRSSNPHFRELSCLSYPHCQSCNFYEHHLDSSRINITSISWHTDWFILAKSSDSWLRILLKHIDVQIRWISENNWREKFLKQCKTTSKAKLQIFWDVMLCHCVCVCVCVCVFLLTFRGIVMRASSGKSSSKLTTSQNTRIFNNGLAWASALALQRKSPLKHKHHLSPVLVISDFLITSVPCTLLHDDVSLLLQR